MPEEHFLEYVSSLCELAADTFSDESPGARAEPGAAHDDLVLAVPAHAALDHQPIAAAVADPWRARDSVNPADVAVAADNGAAGMG